MENVYCVKMRAFNFDKVIFSKWSIESSAYEAIYPWVEDKNEIAKSLNITNMALPEESRIYMRPKKIESKGFIYR